MCDCACAGVTPKFMTRYCLTGKACQPAVMVSKGRGYGEQIVAPRRLPNHPQSGSGLLPIEAEFIDQPCGFKPTE